MSDDQQPGRPTVSTAQAGALVCAIVLLLPGGCFLFFGGLNPNFVPRSSTYVWHSDPDLLAIAAWILALAGLLFWIGARRRPRAALVCAVVLLLLGGCLLSFGSAVPPHIAGADLVLLLLPVAAVLGLAGLLFWVAFRRLPG